jgi:hypothetical protein
MQIIQFHILGAITSQIQPLLLKKIFNNTTSFTWLLLLETKQYLWKYSHITAVTLHVLSTPMFPGVSLCSDHLWYLFASFKLMVVRYVEETNNCTVL